MKNDNLHANALICFSTGIWEHRDPDRCAVRYRLTIVYQKELWFWHRSLPKPINNCPTGRCMYAGMKGGIHCSNAARTLRGWFLRFVAANRVLQPTGQRPTETRGSLVFERPKECRTRQFSLPRLFTKLSIWSIRIIRNSPKQHRSNL